MTLYSRKRGLVSSFGLETLILGHFGRIDPRKVSVFTFFIEQPEMALSTSAAFRNYSEIERYV